MTKRGRAKKIGEFAKGSENRIKEAIQQDPHPIDVNVGQKLRIRRSLAGVSQDQLGKAVGLTFQQIQKYERGANRISCSRLWEFSQLLDVKISWFFSGDGISNTNKFIALAEEQEAFEGENDVLSQKETLDLVAAWYKIKDETTRQKTLDLIKSLGS